MCIRDSSGSGRPLAGPEGSRNGDPAADFVGIGLLEDGQLDIVVPDDHLRPRFDRPDKFGLRDGGAVGVAGDLFAGEGDLMPDRKRIALLPLELADPDLGALQVLADCDRPVELFADPADVMDCLLYTSKPPDPQAERQCQDSGELLSLHLRSFPGQRPSLLMIAYPPRNRKKDSRPERRPPCPHLIRSLSRLSLIHISC